MPVRIFTVYEITGPLGRRYIGCTTTTLKRRWSKQVNQAQGSNTNLCLAIREHGRDAFRIRALVQTRDATAAAELETQFIRAAVVEDPCGLYNVRMRGGSSWWTAKKLPGTAVTTATLSPLDSVAMPCTAVPATPTQEHA